MKTTSILRLLLPLALASSSALAGTVFFENFDNNNAGWTLGTTWAIGPAVAGCGDPGVDADGVAGGGVAGVVLGGCAPTAVHSYYYLTSPTIDTTGGSELHLAFERDLWSDYTPFMKNVIEVFDGSNWNIIFETFGSPGIDDAAWVSQLYDITAYSNTNLRVRWGYSIGSDGVFNRGSWNVDNVHLYDDLEAGAVPEPSTLFLLGGAFLGFAALRRRST